MTGHQPPSPRAPRVFDMTDQPLSDAALKPDTPPLPVRSARSRLPPDVRNSVRPVVELRGFRWGRLLISASIGLLTLAAGVWLTNFATAVLQRQDWLGWTAVTLVAIMAASAGAMVVREIAGYFRLGRLVRLRKAGREALACGDIAAERAFTRTLAAHYASRPDMKWGLSRLAAHQGDVLGRGDLIRLADRELIAPLDVEARRLVLRSAKRVATVTALSPMAAISVVFVLIENVAALRRLADLYGGRPGALGAIRLFRLVLVHILATGGLALTDDLLGQFLGHDLLRRLSRRLGEGAFNGALTARLGVAAIDIIRPLPFVDSEPVRLREIFAELFRSIKTSAPGTSTDAR